AMGNTRSRVVVSGRTHEPCGRQEPGARSEEHTSELQSLTNLVCRLLLEKKKKKKTEDFKETVNKRHKTAGPVASKLGISPHKVDGAIQNNTCTLPPCSAVEVCESRTQQS